MPSVAVFSIALALQLSSATALAEPPAPRPRQELIDLDVKQADLRDVLRLLADVGRVNLVYGEEIQGVVTLRLRRVPWREALRVVLAAKGLEMEQQGNLIRVASAETFAQERALKLDARAQCLQSAPLRTRLIPVNYARAQTLAALIKAKLSARGTVSVDERTNTIVVRDVDCP